jgi:hypothetical protein
MPEPSIGGFLRRAGGKEDGAEGRIDEERGWGADVPGRDVARIRTFSGLSRLGFPGRLLSWRLYATRGDMGARYAGLVSVSQLRAGLVLGAM